MDNRLPTFEKFMVDNKNFPSKFDIGDPVIIEIQNKQIHGWIRTVTFTNGKVRYSVKVPLSDTEGDYTTFHNLDSVLIKSRDGKKMEISDIDNYS